MYEYARSGVVVQTEDVVIDAGANIGFFSAYAAYRGAHVYAFEPFPRAFDYLQRTARINGHLSGKITPVPLALMDTAGEVRMRGSPANLGGTHVVHPDWSRDSGTDAIEIVVQAESLDAWVAANSVSRVDFIKADVEGAERHLLLGAGTVLREFQPRLAVCTYHREDDPSVLETIIRNANPNYTISQGPRKLYAR